MAQPTCPCGSTRFELHEEDIEGATYTLAVIRCASCGLPIGALESENVGDLAADLSRKIDAQGRQIAAMAAEVSELKTKLVSISHLMGLIEGKMK